MAVTLKDIARECGLAVSSVSNILNNNATSYTSEDVRRRVRETAERLGYRKDYLSLSLRTRKTRSVGLILDKIDDATRQDFLVPFVERFSALGYEVALAEHRHDPTRAVAALAGFAERIKEGVVVFTDLLGRTPAEQEQLSSVLRAASFPVLGIGSACKGWLPSLDINRGGAVDRSLAELLAKGRRVLLVYEYDWDLRPNFSYWNHPQVTLWPGIHEFGDFEARLRVEASHGRVLGGFDAVFFRTDRIAIPALELLRQRGVAVPRQLEVLSFDNFAFSEHTLPPLSTWDIGFARVGERSQELLAAWLNGDRPPSDTYELFEPAFIRRNSHQGDKR